jgi:hypothetical protein
MRIWIRIRIHWSEARIRIRTKMSRIHNTEKNINKTSAFKKICAVPLVTHKIIKVGYGKAETVGMLRVYVTGYLPMRNILPFSMQAPDSSRPGGTS